MMHKATTIPEDANASSGVKATDTNGTVRIIRFMQGGLSLTILVPFS